MKLLLSYICVIVLNVFSQLLKILYLKKKVNCFEYLKENLNVKINLQYHI